MTTDELREQPGVQGLVQLAHNAIDRINELENEVAVLKNALFQAQEAAKQLANQKQISSSPMPAQQQEPGAGWDSIEAVAAARYKVVPSHDSMFYRHAVVAGNGTQQLYVGRELECENMARKFAGAFLDGAFVMQGQTSPPAQRKIPQNCGTGYCSCIECLFEPEHQEPVAYAVYHRMGGSKSLHWPEQHSPDGDANQYQIVPLYASPQPSKPWTGLTDEEIEDAWPFVWRKHESVSHFAIYHAIEAKLREKNT